MNYWHSGYWQANYWHSDYWGEFAAPSNVGDYWGANYWHTNYWASGYWAFVEGFTTTISQTSSPVMTMIGQPVTIDISLFVATTTPTMTMTGQAVDASNDVTVEQVSTPTMTMTGVGISADAGEYYVADIGITVFMASNFDFTDTINASSPSTMTMSGNMANIEEGGALVVGVTSTPGMTMSALPTAVSNPVVIMPLTPTMAMTGFDVATGFGTLITATSESMAMSTLQTNVSGESDVNELDVTFDTMIMSELNASVLGTNVSTGAGDIYNAAAAFPTGSTVTIVLYDPILLTAIPVDNDSCLEVESTGTYVWNSSKLTVEPTDYQEYIWSMTDGITFEDGVIRVNAMGVNDLMTYVMENGETYAEQIRLIRADAAGTVVQNASGAYGVRDAADSKDRITSGPGANNGRTVTATDGA